MTALFSRFYHNNRGAKKGARWEKPKEHATCFPRANYDELHTVFCGRVV